jgi:hypothetical protein
MKDDKKFLFAAFWILWPMTETSSITTTLLEPTLRVAMYIKPLLTPSLDKLEAPFGGMPFIRKSKSGSKLAREFFQAVFKCSSKF